MGVDGGEEWPKKGGARAAVVPPDHRPVPCPHLEKPHIMNDESKENFARFEKNYKFCPTSHFDSLVTLMSLLIT